MDLKPGWEKKALIILSIVFIIIVIYAFNPFHSDSNVQEVQNQPVDTAVTTPAAPAVTPDNSTNNTSITNETNGTFQISADVAKNIAAGANPGYTAGQPTQGNVTINNSIFSVWIVPITQGATSKKIYVDLATGTIVGSA
jgi:hypothetical protein